jgi:hypothetical protein
MSSYDNARREADRVRASQERARVESVRVETSRVRSEQIREAQRESDREEERAAKRPTYYSSSISSGSNHPPEAYKPPQPFLVPDSDLNTGTKIAIGLAAVGLAGVMAAIFGSKNSR